MLLYLPQVPGSHSNVRSMLFKIHMGDRSSSRCEFEYRRVYSLSNSRMPECMFSKFRSVTLAICGPNSCTRSLVPFEIMRRYSFACSRSVSSSRKRPRSVICSSCVESIDFVVEPHANVLFTVHGTRLARSAYPTQKDNEMSASRYAKAHAVPDYAVPDCSAKRISQ